jgi:putative ABC transport system permease protein
MALWRQLVRGLRALTHRDDADRDVADEVEHYLEQATAEHLARGLSPAEARRAARLEIGNPTAIREEVRSSGWEHTIETLVADLRYAARRLRGSPGFTSIAVVTLGLGVGASTSVFSAANPILFERLPYPQARRLVTIWEERKDGGRLATTFGAYRAMVERCPAFETLAAMRAWQPTLVGGAEPERLEGQRVTGTYLRVLSVSPSLGRDFLDSEDVLNGPRVAIVSDGLWRRRFGADPSILGRQITLDDVNYTIVGVMPAAFENVLAPAADVWAPLQYDRALPPQGREWGHHLRLVGRLRSDATLEQATAQTSQLLRDMATIYGTAIADYGVPAKFDVNSLQHDITGAVRPALVAVLGAVGLLLAIACVNVTNLLLGRGAQRRDEFAMRVALGAGRGRLIRQLLTESVLLALLGGAVGLLVATAGVRALIALSPPELPRASAIGLDTAVLAFTLGMSMAIGIAVGLIPGLHASRTDLHGNGLRQSARHTAGHQLTRRLLVVAEVALALILLVCAGLLLRSLQRLIAISPGFDSSHLLTMQVQTSRRFDRATTESFFDRALDMVRGVPGVESAAFSSQLPLSGELDEYGVHFEPEPGGQPEGGYSTFRYTVTPGYLETTGIPLRRGRLLDDRDVAGAPISVLISESLAIRKFGNADPIGKRLHLGRQDQPWYTIVGVMGDVKQASLAASQSDAVYITTKQWYFADNVLTLVVRARGDAMALAPAIRNAIWSVNKDQPIVRIATMDELLAATAAERRFAMIVFEVFALAALVLAATGIYGVLSSNVAERTREIGIRTALGASRGNILSLVIRQGMALTAIGMGVGLAGATLASDGLETLLFNVSRIDPITYAGVIAMLLPVSAVACWIPAWRAAWVDPSITLRAE